MKFIIFLFLTSALTYAQSISFFENQSDIKISYPLVYIYNNQNIVELIYGDEEGHINIKPNITYTDILVECLGYTTVKLSKKEITEKIYLIPRTFELKEVVVTNQKTVVLGNNYKKRSLDLMALIKDKFELSFFIENSLKKPSLIKSFKFYYTKKSDKLKYILRFKMYKKIENSDYSNDLVEMPNHVFEIKEKQTKESIYTIDLSNYDLILPLEGVFVSLEVIDIIDENNTEFSNNSNQNGHLLYISSSEKYPKNHTMFNFKNQRFGVGKNENSLGWKKFINAKFVLEVFE